MELTISIEPDEFTDKVAQAFDLEFDGTITTKIPEFSCPPDFNIGMIVGASGSGKSQILHHHFEADGLKDEWTSLNPFPKPSPFCNIILQSNSLIASCVSVSYLGTTTIIS